MLASISARILAIVTLSAALFSCKKKDDDPSGGGETFQILTTDKWTVAASDTITYAAGNTGSGLLTQSFTLQNSNELRWYVGVKAVGNSIQEPTEIILNTAGAVSTRSLVGESYFRRPLQFAAPGNIWTLIEVDNPGVVDILHNGQPASIPTSNLDDYPEEKDHVWPALDGFFVGGPDFTGYDISFFDVNTQRWNKANLAAADAAPIRYNGTTYAIGIEGRFSPRPPELTVWKDTGRFARLMKTDTLTSPALIILNAAVIGKYAFVATTSSGTSENYVVYRIDLETFAVQKVQEQTSSKQFTSAPPFSRFNVQYTEVDGAGNFYMVENRIANQTGHYSIRRYNASGGNDVILAESDLKENSRVEAIRYFNGKLYAAVSYRQSAGGGTSTWYLQMVQLK